MMGSTRKNLRHVGFDEHRLLADQPNETEWAFAKAWTDYNRIRHERYGFLGLLIPDPTQRDAMVAATIIQWLGTSIGLCFLSATIRGSEHLADYLQRAVSYRVRADHRQSREDDRDKLRTVLKYIEESCPELQSAERGTDEFNMFVLINALRSTNGLPWLESTGVKEAEV